MLLAPASAAALRAYSMTAACMPRQMPRKGTLRSRAKRAARDLSLDAAAFLKPPGASTQSTPFERREPVALDVLRVDEIHADPGTDGNPGVDQRLVERLVGVREVDVLAHIPTTTSPLRVVEPRDHLVPLREIDGAAGPRRVPAAP